MNFIDLAQPLPVSVDALRRVLRSRVQAGVWLAEAAEVYFPSPQALEREAPLHALATPWESALEGLRIADLRGTGLRTLDRREGKVLRSAVIREPALVYRAFLDKLHGASLQLSWLQETPWVYSLELCASLLRASFRDATRPRLVPRLAWPSRDECVALVRELVPALPWRLEGVNGVSLLFEIPSGYRFEVRGERGELELERESQAYEAILWDVFSALAQRALFDGDARFVFDQL